MSVCLQAIEEGQAEPKVVEFVPLAKALAKPWRELNMKRTHKLYFALRGALVSSQPAPLSTPSVCVSTWAPDRKQCMLFCRKGLRIRTIGVLLSPPPHVFYKNGRTTVGDVVLGVFLIRPLGCTRVG
jgi:hypothetical protein